MLDRNGVEITVGATAAVEGEDLLNRGKTGRVTFITPHVTHGVCVECEPGAPSWWGSWCRPSDVSVVPAAPGEGEGGAKC